MNTLFIALLAMGMVGAVLLTLFLQSRRPGQGRIGYRPSPVGAGSPGTDALALEMERLAMTVQGPIGVTAIHIESDRHVAVNGDQPFPMASVFKVPLAVTLLSKADAADWISTG